MHKSKIGRTHKREKQRSNTLVAELCREQAQRRKMEEKHRIKTQTGQGQRGEMQKGKTKRRETNMIYADRRDTGRRKADKRQINTERRATDREIQAGETLIEKYR
jgi:hypothetical protein